jgi:two-component system, cell cycle sensor histidine kinase and response regulator CckA
VARPKVMIVEDEYIVAKGIQMSLESLNYRVPAIVTSGEKAIEKAEAESLDLVLMDIVLRGEIDGIDAAKHIRDRFHIPVIYLTAYSEQKIVQRAKETEPYGYLLKPVDQKELQTTIEMALYKAQMEKRLRASEKRYRSLFEKSPDIIYSISSDGKTILSLNPSFQKSTGWAESEWIGEPFSQLLHPDDILRATKFHLHVAAGKTKESAELRIRTKSGDYLTGEFVETPHVENGKLVAFLGFIRDLTERKRMEEELLLMKKAESIGVLARGLAHDFNNILSVVMANASLARLYVEPEGKVSDLLEKIENASEQARKVTSRLINFGKSDDPLTHTIDLTRLLTDTTSFVLSGSSVICSLQIAPDLWPVDVDRDQIRQVITTLLINARDAMSHGGTVAVCAENLAAADAPLLLLENHEYIKISVRDQGTGIPHKYLEKIFDPYFSTKEMGTQKGMGLGLSIARSIIQRHNGRITVQSQPGVETVFSLFLPRSQGRP